MQAGRGAAKPSIGIALDGDLGSRIDAVLAVAMLNGFAAKGEARTIAVGTSKPSLKTAQFVDVLAGFYSGRPLGGVPMIGMADGPSPANDAPVFAGILAAKTPEGAPRYTSNLRDARDTADNAVLIRNVLLAQNDGNAAIVLAGQASGLARLLALYGARPQIAAKVKLLVVAAGAYPSGPADPAVAADVAAARALLTDWPTPIVLAGTEVGAALPYPAASIEHDFAWSQAHPVADAYRAFKPMPYDAPAAALAAALHAVHPDAGYFRLSDPGTVTVHDDGQTTFAAGAGGRQQYLIVDPAQKDRVLKLYTELVSAPPVPRGRGRGGDV